LEENPDLTPEIVADEEVYSPSDDSFLIADHLSVQKDGYVLDMGTGTGILAIKAVLLGARRALAVDINPNASRCALRNAKSNRLRDQINVLTADLFSALREGTLFDVILFNPPYLRTKKSEERRGWLERSWAGGPNGMAVLNRFISKLATYLAADGRLFILHPSYGVRSTIKKLKEAGMDTSMVVSKRLFFERLLVLAARFQKTSRSG
jgi:release factor glutamine methyltransferase